MWSRRLGEEAAGGREEAIEQMESIHKKMKEDGRHFKLFQISEPGDFHTEGESAFVVVPTTIEVAGRGGTVRTKTYLLGISADGGKNWRFAAGAGLEDESARALLPKLPA